MRRRLRRTQSPYIAGSDRNRVQLLPGHRHERSAEILRLGIKSENVMEGVYAPYIACRSGNDHQFPRDLIEKTGCEIETKDVVEGKEIARLPRSHVEPPTCAVGGVSSGASSPTTILVRFPGT